MDNLDEPTTIRQIQGLQVAQFLRSCQYTLTITAQTTLALRITHGDHALVTAMISRSMGMSAFLELLLSPLCGRLSDHYGRKPVLLMAGLAKFVPYIMMATKPSMGAIILSTLLTDASFQTYRLAETALLADKVRGLAPLAIATTRVSSMMGLAAVFGNIAGGSLSMVSLRLPYVVAALCTLGNCAVIAFGVTETAGTGAKVAAARQRQEKEDGMQESHPATVTKVSTGPSEQRQLKRRVPLSSRRQLLPSVLCHGRRLRMLTFSALLSDVVDLTFSVRPIFAQQWIGLTPAQYGYAEAFRGLCQLASSVVSAFTIKLAGPRVYTLLSHTVCAAYHAILALATRPLHLLLSYPPMMLGGMGTRNSALTAMFQREGVAAGLGVGETAAGLRLMSSAISVIMTPSYGWLYSTFSPVIMWTVAGCFSIASAALFSFVPPPDMMAEAASIQ